MCYSAQIRQDYRAWVREWGADVDIDEYQRLYWRRSQGEKILIPKAMDAAFAEPSNALEREIRGLIETFDAQRAHQLEAEIFAQRRRLAEAERRLAVKPTKTASESARIAVARIAAARERLADLGRRRPEPRDERIWPLWYASVLVVENGRRVVKPMRYQCRPAGAPEDFDRRYPGTYNARRDSLGRFWKRQFGHSHALVLVSVFYENVRRHRLEGRGLASGEKEQNVVLEFRPRPAGEMRIACLWSRWRGADGSELLSFASITDAPPPEVAAAGHDRCLIPLKAEHVDAWLRPETTGSAELQAILDDRERPWYEHRLAA